MDAAHLKLEAALRAKQGWARITGSGDKVFIDTVCPRCGKRKLSVNARTGYYRCWRECGNGHIRDILGSGFHLARVNVASPGPQKPARYIAPGYCVPLSVLSESHHAIQYVRRRGFDPKYLDTVFGVGYCAEGEWFGRRGQGPDWERRGSFNTTDTLMFPMRMGGKLVAWQSRLLYDPEPLSEAECYARGMCDDPEDGKLIRFPKYFTMPGFQKGAMLFNYDNAKTSEVVAVAEGTFDAIGIGACAVATLGKGVSPTQVSMLAANWKLALLLLDPDAEEQNLELRESLQRHGMPSVCVKLADGTDPGSTPRELIWRRIYESCVAASVDLTRFRLQI